MLALLGVGLALAVAGVALIATAAQWWQEHKKEQWPRAEAVIRECKIVPHRGVRGSRMTTHSADCSIAFTAAGSRVEGGFSTIPSSLPQRIETFRAWIAQHPPGTRIAVRYDPAWPPSATPENPEIFQVGSTPLFVKIAEIAGMAAVVLLASAFLLRPRDGGTG